jgi:hypothetical protein
LSKCIFPWVNERLNEPQRYGYEKVLENKAERFFCYYNSKVIALSYLKLFGELHRLQYSMIAEMVSSISVMLPGFIKNPCTDML